MTLGGIALLTACQTTTSQQLSVHEVQLYSDSGNEQIAWVYGHLNAPSHLNIGGETVTLQPSAPADELSVNGSLGVMGNSVFRKTLSDYQGTAPTLSLVGETLQVEAPSPIQRILVREGNIWKDSKTGVTGFKGLGNLTDDEANTLERWLTTRGARGVALLPETTQGLHIEPTSKQQKTALYVIYQMPSATTSMTSSTSTTHTITHTPNPHSSAIKSTSTTTSATMSSGWETIASGQQSKARSRGYLVATSDTEVKRLYNIAYGYQSNTPSADPLGNHTLIALFAGQFMTGGYSIKVEDINTTGGVLTIRTSITTPREGMLTTQAITYPWTMIRVAGQYRDIRVLDEEGRPLSDTGDTEGHSSR